MTHSIAPLLKRFFSHYLPIQRKLSINTILAYRDATKLLLCYAAETLKHSVDKLDVEDITEKTVLGFLDNIEKERECTASTRNARLAAIRSLFAFIAREEPVLVEQCQQVRSIPLKRTRHKSIDYLKEEEIQAVLDAVDINSRTGIRDKALLMLLYNTGARVSEIIGIEHTDLQLDKAPQVKLHGKGNKDRSCPLWPETVTALNAYIRQRVPEDSETKQIFLNAKGGPITRFGIRHVTRKYGFIAQVKQPALKAKPLNPHRIRHTTAMHLLHANNEIAMISYWLGHANLNTTHMYVEIDMEMKRKMLETVDAPKDKSKPPWKKASMLRWLEKLTLQPELCAVN